MIAVGHGLRQTHQRINATKMAFDLATAILAAMAAYFWFRSASGDAPILGTYWDAVPKGDPFMVAMDRSTRLNRYAAFFAGGSAFFAGGSALCSVAAWIFNRRRVR